MLEYDGEQHFRYSSYFHKTVENFEIRKKQDIRYTLEAIKSDYKMIRIDYTQYKLIEQHIINALSSDNVCLLFIITSLLSHYRTIFRFIMFVLKNCT